MIKKRLDDQISKTIKKYLKKQGRIGFQLRQLNELFRNGAKIDHQLKIIQQNHSLLVTFKLFLLFHRLAIENTQSKDTLVEIVTALGYEPSDDFQKLLSNKLMEPYRLYIQRRTLLLSTENNSHNKNIPRKQQREAKVYQLINLITLGTSFADIIYIFGRYYLDKFTCAIDFNIILGADLQGLYHDMVQNIQKPARKEVLDEIQVLHEKMYVVFYNCYFHRYLKNYVPKWVLTDIGHSRFSTPQKQSGKSTLSRTGTSSTKNRSFSSVKEKKEVKSSVKMSDLGESCLFLKERVEEEVDNIEQQIDFPEQSLVNSSIGFKSAPKQFQKQLFPENLPLPQKNPQKGVQKQQLQLLKSMQRVLSNFNSHSL